MSAPPKAKTWPSLRSRLCQRRSRLRKPTWPQASTWPILGLSTVSKLLRGTASPPLKALESLKTSKSLSCVSKLGLSWVYILGLSTVSKLLRGSFDPPLKSLKSFKTLQTSKSLNLAGLCQHLQKLQLGQSWVYLRCQSCYMALFCHT